MINNEKSVWKKASPAIPVRENMKTSYLQLSCMHGDHLPRLKKIERPEFSNEVRHYESVCQTALMKNLNIMYKDHKHMMRKLARGQDTAYKTMCRVQREKRKVQRAECVKQQEELRDKMKSHRMRALLMNVVVKFKENSRRKKAQRALANIKNEQSHESSKRDTLKPKSSDFKTNSENKGKSIYVSSETNSTLSINYSSYDEKSKTMNHDRDLTVFSERKGSLSKDKKSNKAEVKTAENRERWDSDSKTLRVEQSQLEMKKSRAMEVSKSVSKPVTRTKGTEGREKSFQNDKKQTENSKPCGTSATTSVELTAKDSVEKVERERLKRASIFMDESKPDYGWFTVGNPVFDGAQTHPTGIECEEHSIREESIDAKSDRVQMSLPPVRTRRPGIARPPSSYLKDQLNSNGTSCDFDSTNTKSESFERVSKSQEGTTASDLDLRLSANNHGSRADRLTSSESGLADLEIRRQMSSSCDPAIPPQRTNIDHSRGSKSVLVPVVPRLHPKKHQPHKDNHMSANMMWVLREEDKSKKKWKKMMSDEEKILKYHRNKDGQFVPTVTNKRELFLPPSNKERHRQQKLLVGEKAMASDRRERIDEFYKTIILPGETPNMFLYDMPPPEPPKKQKPKGHSSMFGSMYDAFKDKDMVNPVHADSYEAMKGVAYLRVREEDDHTQHIPVDQE